MFYRFIEKSQGTWTNQGNRGEISMTNRIVRLTLASAMALSFGLPMEASAQSKPKKEPTAAQLAVRERMSKCSAEWKQAKTSGKTAPGETWPKFWSACNKRLKGGDKA
jgi:hypothetical protein